MTLFLQFAIAGITMGALYSLIALGFVLIYKSSKILNFAQGEFVLVGGYVGLFFITQLGLPIWLGVVFLVAALALLGFVIEKLTIRPLVGQPILAIIIMTLGLSLLINGTVICITGSELGTYPQFIPTAPIKIGGAVFSQVYAWCFGIAVILVALSTYFFLHTRYGLYMRATAESHEVAQSVGIKVKSTFTLAWVIAAAIGGIGGFLLGIIMGVSGDLSEFGLKVFPVVLLGGLESIPGAIIGGMVIGLLENVAAGYLDPLVGGGVTEIFPYIIMVVILIFKPYGLFGLIRIERI
ncbi:MAG: branched-chain amino acid ABC transporter permease [Deltaproteobacteria bacterium]|nr:branched-chain amino acid ABC transporter permease [Deltaproteobacteria bacterium]